MRGRVASCMSRHAMRRGRLRRLTAQAQGKAHHGRHSLWSHKICLRWPPRASCAGPRTRCPLSKGLDPARSGAWADRFPPGNFFIISGELLWWEDHSAEPQHIVVARSRAWIEALPPGPKVRMLPPPNTITSEGPRESIVRYNFAMTDVVATPPLAHGHFPLPAHACPLNAQTYLSGRVQTFCVPDWRG